jgi:hypothetical protein
MLEAAARRCPNRAEVLSVDQYVSPGNRYNAMLDGKLCRFDGVHLTIFCGEKLQEPMLSTVSTLAQK